MLLLQVGIIVIRRGDRHLVLHCAERQRVLDVASNNQFERILQNLFPALGSSGFGPVAWMREPNFANRLGVMPLEERAVKG